MRNYSRGSITGLLIALIALGTAADVQAQAYSVMRLETLGGGTSKRSVINASGQVAGEAVTANGKLHANRVMHDLKFHDRSRSCGARYSGFGPRHQ